LPIRWQQEEGDIVTDLEEMGPVDYLVVEFPGGQPTGKGLPLFVDLVDRGIVRILDLMFVRRPVDGPPAEVPLADLVGDAADLAVFDGAASGLLGPEDVADVGTVIEPGSLAAVLVYENTWAAPLAVTLREGGAQLVATARIPVQGLLAALDAADVRNPAPAA
jgi:hypothetical protein